MASKNTTERTQHKASASDGGKKKSNGGDAIAVLRADHKHVSDLFSQFDKARTRARKQTLAQQICRELTVHAQVEEEIFYPAFRLATHDKHLVPEATVEHQTMKDLIAQIEGDGPDGKLFDAKVKVLGEYVKHHVKEEQNEIFPKAKSSKLQLETMGDEIRVRKDALMASVQ
jgi:hemerythrin superfamily protein